MSLMGQCYICCTASSRALAIYARTFGHQFLVRSIRSPHATNGDAFALTGPIPLKLSSFAASNTSTTPISGSIDNEYKGVALSATTSVLASSGRPHYDNDDAHVDALHTVPAFTYCYTPNGPTGSNGSFDVLS
jgi:hypothetical protein